MGVEASALHMQAQVHIAPHDITEGEVVDLRLLLPLTDIVLEYLSTGRQTDESHLKATRTDSAAPCGTCYTKTHLLGCITPCAHAQHCVACLQKVKRCPSCRGVILRVQPLYLD